MAVFVPSQTQAGAVMVGNNLDHIPQYCLKRGLLATKATQAKPLPSLQTVHHMQSTHR